MASPAANPGAQAAAEQELGHLVRTILEQGALSPAEILNSARAQLPAVTMDRVLVALYADSAVFRRAGGKWYAQPQTPALTSVPGLAP